MKVFKIKDPKIPFPTKPNVEDFDFSDDPQYCIKKINFHNNVPACIQQNSNNKREY